MTEEGLINYVVMRLFPLGIGYVKVRNPTTRAQLLQLVAKYEEWHGGPKPMVRVVVLDGKNGIRVEGHHTNV
ncbi:hypothetical protein TNCV_2189791 [Trichonephila clavipes]|nr:hypothetical protein TNCV_2189791 [Trichonephila clavipes]